VLLASASRIWRRNPIAWSASDSFCSALRASFSSTAI
jgi:hypothetical protein